MTIEFDRDGFLYKMVRLIVGALVKCALGKMPIEDVTARLDAGQTGTARFAAPAEGLFLLSCGLLTPSHSGLMRPRLNREFTNTKTIWI